MRGLLFSKKKKFFFFFFHSRNLKIATTKRRRSGVENKRKAPSPSLSFPLFSLGPNLTIRAVLEVVDRDPGLVSRGAAARLLEGREFC